jgi:hypothetical protein
VGIHSAFAFADAQIRRGYSASIRLNPELNMTWWLTLRADRYVENLAAGQDLEQGLGGSAGAKIKQNFFLFSRPERMAALSFP